MPHSGNTCSGLCENADCWQCVEAKAKAKDAAAAKRVLGQEAPKSREEKAREVERLRRALADVESIAAAKEAQLAALAAKDAETTTITRAALEGLVARIPGVTVNWNGGDPIFYDRGTNLTSQDVANKLGRSAMSAMDGMVRDVLTGRAVVADRKVKDALKAKGATDADIAAAEKLLRGAPLSPRNSKPMGYFDELGWTRNWGVVSLDETHEWTTIDVTDIIKAWEPKGRPYFEVYNAAEDTERG